MTLVVKCIILLCIEHIHGPTLSTILPFNYQPRSYVILSMTHFTDKKNEVQSDKLTSSRPYCYELVKVSWTSSQFWVYMFIITLSCLQAGRRTNKQTNKYSLNKLQESKKCISEKYERKQITHKKIYGFTKKALVFVYLLSDEFTVSKKNLKTERKRSCM